MRPALRRIVCMDANHLGRTCNCPEGLEFGDLTFGAETSRLQGGCPTPGLDMQTAMRSSSNRRSAISRTYLAAGQGGFKWASIRRKLLRERTLS